MKPLTRCIFCNRVLVLSTFVCANCAATIERRIMWAIAIVLPAGVAVLTILTRWAWKEAR